MNNDLRITASTSVEPAVQLLWCEWRQLCWSQSRAPPAASHPVAVPPTKPRLGLSHLEQITVYLLTQLAILAFLLCICPLPVACWPWLILPSPPPPVLPAPLWLRSPKPLSHQPCSPVFSHNQLFFSFPNPPWSLCSARPWFIPFSSFCLPSKSHGWHCYRAFTQLSPLIPTGLVLVYWSTRHSTKLCFKITEKFFFFSQRWMIDVSCGPSWRLVLFCFMSEYFFIWLKWLSKV